MKILRTQFLAAILLAPFIAAASAPTIKITTPTKTATTDGVLNASGTAKGTASIASVHYSFDGGPWTLATGTNVWSVTGLALTASTNTFSAYATDTNSVNSKTDTVAFVYIVNVPITLLTNGFGTITPYADGALLEVGKKYTLSAKAAKGFGFTGWTGSVMSASSKLTFNMASNLSFTANFADITRPLCVITFPAVKQSLSNSPITITGRASDNVGVTAVNYQFNGGGWNPATLSDDNTNWTVANITPVANTNTIQAFAEDAAGNRSLTNTVVFTYTPQPVTGPAPASLSGKVAEIMVNGDTGPFLISYGDNTFAMDSTNGSEQTGQSGVGNYSYTLTSSNTAQLNLSNVLPPTNTPSGDLLSLTFSNDTEGTFTDTNGDIGIFELTAAQNLAPSPSAIITAQYVDLSGNTNIIEFGGGMFTNTDSFGDTNWGACTVVPFSPQDIVLTEYFMDDLLSSNVGYVQLDFFAANTGNFFFNLFDNMGNFQNSDSGTFTGLSLTNPPAGNAPASIAGTQWAVSPIGQDAINFCFADDSFSGTSKDTNEDELGVYSYIKTGPNTAQLNQYQTAPPSGGQGGGGGGSLVYLTFSKTTAATFAITNNNGGLQVITGSISAQPVANLAPGSLAGKTYKITFPGNTATVTLHSDGTFSNNDSNGTINSGNYTYNVYSPIGALMVLSITSGSDAGNTAYVEMTFTSSTAGNAYATSFDSGGNLVDAHGGAFKQQ